ncbi:MAG: metal-dependent transcriptional regulator [Fibrobacter sp.]|jgi:DtxR family Mn-dependent transcriptional regulator|nr:metal-dependent transcriptional regulator [Fibrobacter sp.]
MESIKLSKSLEDYLEMILMLHKATGRVRVKDLAVALSVKMPSVAKAMSLLKLQNLVEQEAYGDIELTPMGKKVAQKILNRHLLLKSFLMNIGVSEEVASEEACVMEHILSAETLERIESLNEKLKAKK